MFFRVRDLELRRVHFAVEYYAGEINYLDDEIRQKDFLKATGVAELLSNTLGEIRVKGHLSVSIEAPCDRCLEPAELGLDSDFDLFYRPVIRGHRHQEVEIDAGECEIAFYEGDGIALVDVLREFVVLNLPMQKLCRQDCKGICLMCGGNKNAAACSCRAAPADERWAGLRNW